MNPKHEQALTRLEVCATLAALSLLFAIAGSALTMTGVRVDRLVCVSNLGEIGKGYNRWAAEHDDRYPFNVDRGGGGIRTQAPVGLEPNAWFQFAWISNELSSARILACPSDTRKPAGDFSLTPNGLLHPSRRNNAVSYFVTHTTALYGQSTLAGDRNATSPAAWVDCSFFGQINFLILGQNNGFGPPTRWTTALHSEYGNLLFRDGSVAETDSTQLRESLVSLERGDGVHLILP